MNKKHLVKSIRYREEQYSYHPAFQSRFYAYPDLISRLSLEHELQGHEGCVNCLQWNQTGSLLASGSDDLSIIIWDPHRRKKVARLETGHTNNVFSVQFMPESCDNTVISAAGDCKIRVHDVRREQCLDTIACHVQRVKRLAVLPNQPSVFLSAAEDGTVMQFDLRTPHHCNETCGHVLINLNAHMGPYAEAKCIAVNPARPELIAVGANDPFVRVFDRRMLRLKSVRFPSLNPDAPPWGRYVTHACGLEGESYNMPINSARYYVPGQLPSSYKEFKRRYRPLATTYLTFSPNGKELLVNLGGEQIYLFDVNSNRRSVLKDLKEVLAANRSVIAPGESDVSASNGTHLAHSTAPCVAASSRNGAFGSSNHLHGSSSAASRRGSRSRISINNRLAAVFSVLNNSGPAPEAAAVAGGGDGNTSSPPVVGDASPVPAAAIPLTAKVDLLKRRANQSFEAQQYPYAIMLYNEAIHQISSSPILYANRAAAYIKRNWNGDMYAALRDCKSTLLLDGDHLKAHFRLARCLCEMKFAKEAKLCLELFKLKFPDHVGSPAFSILERDIQCKLMSDSGPNGSKNRAGFGPDEDSISLPSSISSSSSGNSSSDEDWDENILSRKSVGHYPRTSTSERTGQDSSSEPPVIGDADPSRGDRRDDTNNPLESSTSGVSFRNRNRSSQDRKPGPSDEERCWRSMASDYERRYCGHCNTTTDIKEANFFGSNGQYIVAGSDDGSFFVWDKETSNIVRILKGDDSIVNCLQPHPTLCLLATSGIDPIVRLWAPLPEGYQDERAVEDMDTAAKANQQRMNSDPLEVMLMNMGYRLTGFVDPSVPPDEPRNASVAQCPQS